MVRSSIRSSVLAALLFIASDAQPQSLETPGLTLARAAAAQIGVTVRYDPAYVKLTYPGGDVPADRGVCTDVVVRAFRRLGVDLQKEVHEDMRHNFRKYPRNWGLRGPDRNIDHRRVPNLMTFFERKGRKLATGATVMPGDVIAWRLPGGLLHIGVASEKISRISGRRLMIHNIGQGAREEDILEEFERIGHYRW